MIRFYPKASLILLLLIGGIHPVVAQQIKTFRGPYTLLNGVEGNASYSYYLDAANQKVFQGRFTFVSDALELEDDDDIQQVSLSGTYRNNQKSGDWSYEVNDYTVRIRKVTGLNVDAVLDGKRRKINAKYTNGIAEGKWTVSISEVESSRPKGVNATSEVLFRQGKAIGKFNYKDEGATPLTIEGQFDQSGNFDGKWDLVYFRDGVRYSETREYVQGFLIGLTQVNMRSSEVIFEENFEAIRAKLNYLEEAKNGANFKRGDKSFGILFDDGYRHDDSKIKAQEMGNRILTEVFSYYSDSSSLIFKLPGFEIPRIGLTRRFQYVYPAGERELMVAISPMARKMYVQYDSILNTTHFKINRQRNDSLAYFGEFLELARKKTDKVLEVMEDLQSGRFDYQFRDNYYQNGVEELSKEDTVKYEFNGGVRSHVISFSNGVNGPDSLVLNIYRYVDGLERYASRYLNRINKTLKGYQQEEKISELDEKIIAAIENVNLLYLGARKLEAGASDADLRSKKEINDLQFQVYKKFAMERKNFRVQNYVNAEGFEKKMDMGQNIIELMQVLINLYPQLEKIPALSGKLDQIYTRYTPNPFFERDVVTRIKQPIYTKGVEVLLPYMIEEIGMSNNRQELKERVDAVFKLDAKLRELAERDDLDANRLNSRMRRENQPERIKRLLGLN